MNLVLLPGVWQTPKDVFDFRKSAAWQDLEAKAEAFGFKTLCWIQISGGMASKGRPILVPADLAGQKVRAAGKMMEAALQKAGAEHGVDGLGRNPTARCSWACSMACGPRRARSARIVCSRWRSITTRPRTTASTTRSSRSLIGMKSWRKLTPEQQKILADAGQSLEQQAFASAVADDKRVAGLFAKAGSQVHKMTLPEWKQWQALFRDVSWPKFRAEVPGGAALLDKSLAATGAAK